LIQRGDKYKLKITIWTGQGKEKEDLERGAVVGSYLRGVGSVLVTNERERDKYGLKLVWDGHLLHPARGMSSRERMMGERGLMGGVTHGRDRATSRLTRRFSEMGFGTKRS